MASRLELHNELKNLMGSENVYYQPPESLKMEYPAIRYSLKNIESTFANNARYSLQIYYELIVISKTPDPEVIHKLLGLPYCSFDRHYKSDNLNHYVFTLHY